MIKGIIIRGVGGNYYVDIGNKVVECRARGLFRLKNIKPLVGDKVLIRITEEDEDAGYIEEVLERTNEIKRPSIANVEQLIVIFAVRSPDPDYLLLDKLLIAAELNHINPIICFNKFDLAEEGQEEDILNIYKNTAYKIIFTSKYNKESIKELKTILRDKLNVFSGPSGVGKSSLLNALQPDFYLQTGEISEKLRRGRHTTRHAEIYKFSFGGYAVDTPGFSSFQLEGIDEYELRMYYPEINKYGESCKFLDCLHYKEPGCSVKEALKDDLISNIRYNNYQRLLEEIKRNKPY
ncbi:MAG: ribosome small subunit-dependent GTPase A [Tissierellia bacterium]|nr:ribosome small subunit-dependent GTPase A [Tissierellia bacterium]